MTYMISGARRLLNLGHACSYQQSSDNAIPHGAAVAWGMLFAYEYGRKRCWIKRN